MMLASAIKKGFPLGVSLPDELRALCDFADEHGPEISGHFEFELNGRVAARAWFDNDPEPAKQFAVFGVGPDGSLYALWLHAGRDSTRAPVVLLTSDGADSQVIASDVSEFLRLLAIGADEPGRYPTLPPRNPKSAAKLRKWLKDEYDLTRPKSGAQIVTEAQTKHPDLMAWIREWQRRHFANA